MPPAARPALAPAAPTRDAEAAAIHARTCDRKRDTRCTIRAIRCTTPATIRGTRDPSYATGHAPSLYGGDYASADARAARRAADADQQLMTLLRRLTAIASRPGDFSTAPRNATRRGQRRHERGRRRRRASRHRFPALRRPGGGSSARAAALPSPAARRWRTPHDGLTGLMAVNLIRAHREELLQASSGKLDHMVIDVVGSLFDQILSDSRVPPQMARQIARLQLPVLRVALQRPDLLLDAPPSGAPLHQPHRVAGLRVRRNSTTGRASSSSTRVAQARAGDRRRRLRPDRALRRQARASSSASSPSRPKAQVEQPARPQHAREQGVGAAHPAALHAAAAAALGAAGAARLPAATSCPGLEPGAGARRRAATAPSRDRAQRYRARRRATW